VVSRPYFWSRSREAMVSISWEVVLRSRIYLINSYKPNEVIYPTHPKTLLFSLLTSNVVSNLPHLAVFIGHVLMLFTYLLVLKLLNIHMIAVTEMQLSDVFKMEQFCSIRPLFERVLCVPASSAPVERMFSQSVLIMKPNRARMSDVLLEELVFLKCNDC